MTKPYVVILLGPPGSGKGTQAKLIKEELKLAHIATGDMLREEVKKASEIGLKAKKFMDEGKFPPEQLILDLLFTRVKKGDCKNGFILDGFPRTIFQAEELDKFLKDQFDLHVVNLHLLDEEIIKRLSNRLICKNCEAPYHKIFHPPKKEGICDVCGGALYQRSDDKVQVIKKRLEMYHEKTSPLLSFYKNKDLLRSINAEGDIDFIFEKIKKALHI